MNGEVLVETADVGRELRVSSERVRQLANAGRLPVAAITRRGCRLFRLVDVDAFRRARDRARAVRDTERPAAEEGAS